MHGRHPGRFRRLRPSVSVLRLPARYRADTSLYNSYVRGLVLRFEFNFLASRDTFAALYRREPGYVPGLYGLAHAYSFLALNDLTDADEAWSRVEALAKTASALDSTAANAWLMLASKEMFADLDLRRAGEHVARARMLDSLDPDVAGFQSVWFRQRGEMDSAVALAKLAHKLDPMSRYFDRLVAKQLYFARRYDESKAVYDRMLEEDPNWKRGYEELAELHLAMGHPRDALECMRRARLAAADSAGATALLTASTDAAAAKLITADARRTLTELDQSAATGQRAPPFRRASLYAVLRDTLATLRWLDSALTRRDGAVYVVRLNPLFDFLRNEPRYKAWEARTGLQPFDRPVSER